MRSVPFDCEDFFPPPPKLNESPAASSMPSRLSSDISRQRDSRPTRRNDAGWSSYPRPADQLVHVLENERECGEPIPAPMPATTYGPGAPPWNAVTSKPSPAKAPSPSPTRSK